MPARFAPAAIDSTAVDSTGIRSTVGNPTAGIPTVGNPTGFAPDVRAGISIIAPAPVIASATGSAAAARRNAREGETLPLDRRDPPRWPAQPFRLQVASDAHTPAINRLRETAYAKAGYFSLPDPRTVHRVSDSPDAICLALKCGDTLAATARFTPARTRKHAEAVLEGDADLPPHGFPSIVLCRGATDPAFRGLGLMAFMAALGVRIAQRMHFGTACAVMYDGTPHLRAMRRAGWAVKPIHGDRMATVKGNAGLSLVYIGSLAFEDSTAHSAAVHARLQEQVGCDAVVNDVCRRLRIRPG